MFKRFIDLSGATSAKIIAEQKFAVQDLEAAIVFATMAKRLDPSVDGIDEALIAYKIHLAASIKCSNGETDWHKVIGMKKGFADKESIKKQHNTLVAMLNPSKKASQATVGAFRLINHAYSILSNQNKRKVAKVAFLNQETHGPLTHVDCSLKKESGGKRGSIKVNKKACPRCRRWCKYETPKCSNNYKHRDTNSITVLQIECPNCRCKFDPISGKTPSSRFSVVP